MRIKVTNSRPTEAIYYTTAYAIERWHPSNPVQNTWYLVWLDWESASFGRVLGSMIHIPCFVDDFGNLQPCSK